MLMSSVPNTPSTSRVPKVSSFVSSFVRIEGQKIYGKMRATALKNQPGNRIIPSRLCRNILLGNTREIVITQEVPWALKMDVPGNW